MYKNVNNHQQGDSCTKLCNSRTKLCTNRTRLCTSRTKLCNFQTINISCSVAQSWAQIEQSCAIFSLNFCLSASKNLSVFKMSDIYALSAVQIRRKIFVYQFCQKDLLNTLRHNCWRLDWSEIWSEICIFL